MTVRYCTDAEITEWDALLLKNPDGGNVFASREMAEIKHYGGWTPRYLHADGLVILALEKSIPLLGKFWYLPKGPGVRTTDELAKLLPKLRDFATSQRVFVVKIEPEITETDGAKKTLASLGLDKTFAVQPNASTVLIDLAPSEDEILASLNQKGRHAIRRAQRDGVTTKPVDFTDEHCRIMYDLLRETAEGQWRARGYDYFKKFWTTFHEANMGQLFFAYYEGEVVASSFGVILGDKATYKDGASIRKRTAYGASHLLQWEMMRWMKAHGATNYDLCGVPHSGVIRDETHHFYGLGRFKTSFNKEVTDYVGAYNLPVRPFAYKLWVGLGQRVVLRLHATRHHTEWY